MLTKLWIENFKGFEKYSIEFERLNLLVGGNNSGKTTVFHALQFFFWALEQIASEPSPAITLGKTQTSNIPVVPYAEVRDLFFAQRMRTGRNPTHIAVGIEAEDAPQVRIEMYQAYGRNFMIAGNDLSLTTDEYQALQRLNPVYVPSTVGITAREDYYRPIALKTMIHQGRQNQVLRNLVYQVRESGEWEEFSEIMRPLFQLQDIDVPFDAAADLWLRAVYKENECSFDFVSAGSGFLQVVNLLTFLFRSPTQLALLDEPDSHMHEDLLRLAFELLDRLSRRRELQLLIASHSPVLIDAAGLSNILLIDRADGAPKRAQNVDSLVPLLADRGLSLPPSKVMDTLKSRRVLFVEGEEKDYEQFIVAFGDVLDPAFRYRIRGLSVFEIGEGRKDWPFDAIAAFRRLVGVDIDYIYVSDRDLLMPQEVDKREERAKAENHRIYHLERRNRECYLVEPQVLSRLLSQRWNYSDAGKPPPDFFSANDIKDWFLSHARSEEDSVRTALEVENERFLRGDAHHRTEKLKNLHGYFRAEFTERLEKGEIPLKLLDGKKAIKTFRRHVADKYGIHFRDIDIIGAFEPDEVPREIQTIIRSLADMFQPDIIPSSTAKAVASNRKESEANVLFKK